MRKEKELQEKIEQEINQLLTKVSDVPKELIPQVNRSNDFAYPYIDIGFDGTLYLVVRERGIECERIMYNNLDLLLRDVFERLSFELAVKYELENRKNDAEYSFKKIEKIQNDYLKKFNENW